MPRLPALALWEASHVSASLRNSTRSIFGCENGWQIMACGQPTKFVNKALLEQLCLLVYVLSVAAFMTELNNCDRNSKACQAKDIYSLTLSEKV